MFLFNHDEYRGLAEDSALWGCRKKRECCLGFLAVIFQIFDKVSLTTRILSGRGEGKGRVWEVFKEERLWEVSQICRGSVSKWWLVPHGSVGHTEERDHPRGPASAQPCKMPSLRSAVHQQIAVKLPNYLKTSTLHIKPNNTNQKITTPPSPQQDIPCTIPPKKIDYREFVFCPRAIPGWSGLP